MSDDEADPFESFDDVEDREGDPFERLGDVGPAEEPDDATPTGEADGDTAAPQSGGVPDSDGPSDVPAFEEEFIDEDDPFPVGASKTPNTSPADETAGGDEDGSLGADDPFAGMDGREGDPFGEGESAFESVDIEEVDPDEVWEALDEEPVQSAVEGSRYVEVSKHRFCEQCEHFTSPPNAHCTNEEAEIIEFLDMETVRLLNCPVVAEQRELENEE